MERDGKEIFENISKLITHSQPLPSVDGVFIDLIVEKTKKPSLRR